MSLFESFTFYSWCIIALFYLYWFTYWKRRGVPYLTPIFPFGNITNLMLRQNTLSQQFSIFYKKIKQQGHKHGGVYLFTRPYYIPTHPDIIKNILIRDFECFMNRGSYADPVIDPLSSHLFNLNDDKWKKVRAKLTPTFTSNRMKLIFDTMFGAASEMKKYLHKTYEANRPLDIKATLEHFFLDIIGLCAFGLEFDALRSENNELCKMTEALLTFNNWDRLNFLSRFVLPNYFFKLVKIPLFPPKVTEFMLNTTKQTEEYRKANNVIRPDLFESLLQLKNQQEDNLTLEEMSAQVFIFIMAGYETSATTLTYAMYELARNQDLQEKARAEIGTVLKQHENKLNYEALREMTYLEKVLHESMRKYPALPYIKRVCTKEYAIPDTEVTLEKGTMIMIPLMALHHDPDFYPNPEQFDPERFSDEEKAKRPSVTFLPFGDGPRFCIGSRFALMQTKIGLVTLLQNYRFRVNGKTVEPLQFDRDSTVVMKTVTPIYLDMFKIDK